MKKYLVCQYWNCLGSLSIRGQFENLEDANKFADLLRKSYEDYEYVILSSEV